MKRFFKRHQQENHAFYITPDFFKRCMLMMVVFALILQALTTNRLQICAYHYTGLPNIDDYRSIEHYEVYMNPHRGGAITLDTAEICELLEILQDGVFQPCGPPWWGILGVNVIEYIRFEYLDRTYTIGWEGDILIVGIDGHYSFYVCSTQPDFRLRLSKC